MDVRAVIFDLDGTLIDSAQSIGFILNELRSENGLPLLPEQCFKRWISLGADELIRKALDLDAEAAIKALAEFRRRYTAMKTPEGIVFGGAMKVLAHLKSQNVRMAVCSNKPEALCLKVLADLGMTPFFGAVIGGDTTEHRKPHPKPFTEALSKIGVSAKDAVLVGDSTIDQRGAAAVGMRFIFFKGGYDDGVDVGASDGQIDSLADLTALISVNAPMKIA